MLVFIVQLISKKFLYFFIPIIAFTIILSNPGFSQQLLVPQEYPTIQAAIDAAVDGDTVLVSDNTYFENISFKGKAITVASYFLIDGDTLHINNTIINGSQSIDPDSGSVVSFVSGEDTNSVLCGFTITGGYGTFTFNEWDGGGIYCYSSGAKIIFNKIINNTLSGAESAWGGGISGSGPGYLIIKDNIIANNNVYSGLTFGGGISVYLNSGCIYNNIIHQNKSECNSGNGWSVAGGISCFATSGDGNFFKISGNSVTYNQSISNSTLGANAGGIDVYDISVTVENNNISNNVVSNSIYSRGGRMQLVYSDSTSIVKNNIFESNSATGTINIDSRGGGLDLVFTNGVLIEGNHFESNFAEHGGAINLYEDSKSLIIKNKIIENFTVAGGGIYIDNSGPTIQNNLIVSNSGDLGGAINITSPVIKTATITPNRESMALGFIDKFGGNRLSKDHYTKKIINRNGLLQPEITNNTIVNNLSSQNYGGVYVLNANPILMNNIIWGNDGDEINSGSSSNTVMYSDIEGGYTGLGNINSFPDFSDNINYYLNSLSPCIDAGNPDTSYNDIEDPNSPGFALFPAMGTLRNDMGVYGDGGSGSTVVPVELTSFTGSSVDGNVTLNWSTATEINNRAFEIERRKENSDFVLIGFVEGKGTTTEQHNYSIIDKNVSSGKYFYRLKQIDFDGTFEYSNEIEIEAAPVSFSLEQNYPNPFNPSTKISYSIPHKSFVTLKVYDPLGSIVSELVGEEKEAGRYELEFNAIDLSSGVYFYKIEARDFVQTKKMILVK